MTPTEVVEPYAPKIVDLLMKLVRNENEDNAVLCMKTIMDFQRHQTKVLAERVQPFLDLIQEMFEMMAQAVTDTFDTPSQSTTQGASSASNNPQNFQSPSPRSPM